MPFSQLNVPVGGYKVIYADPAWKFSNKKTGGSMKSGADHQYDVMTIDDLKALPVGDIAADNAILFMWYVGAMPQEAIDLVSAWGFTLKNMNGFVWSKLTKTNKPHFGMGFYTRAGSESVIIATKGKYKPASHGVRAVFNGDDQIQFEGQALIHSRKPHQVRDLIVELCADVPRLEMFARETADGWHSWGNEL